MAWNPRVIFIPSLVSTTSIVSFMALAPIDGLDSSLNFTNLTGSVYFNSLLLFCEFSDSFPSGLKLASTMAIVSLVNSTILIHSPFIMIKNCLVNLYLPLFFILLSLPVSVFSSTLLIDSFSYTVLVISPFTSSILVTTLKSVP